MHREVDVQEEADKQQSCLLIVQQCHLMIKIISKQLKQLFGFLFIQFTAKTHSFSHVIEFQTFTAADPRGVFPSCLK
jgi:hypothetical protein